MIEIVAAENEAHYRQARELWAELTVWDAAEASRLGLDAGEVMDFYYGSDGEALPGGYAPPAGCILLATATGGALGCIAFHPLEPGICEVRRMYVRPEMRGQRIGRLLAVGLIAAARRAGYRAMRLETTTFMERAVALYRSLGFRPCAPYYAIPESFKTVSLFMELDLTATA